MLHQARLLSFDPDTTLDIKGDGWSYLLGFISHPCAFLKPGGLCSIHDCAPLSCRRYPFMVNGSLNARFCPLPSGLMFRIKGPGSKPDQLVQELEAHKRIVKEWNKKPGKKEDCIKFLLDRAVSITHDPAV
jgi:Fe-S-cluster containining protein